jgi:hypothetical protein
VASVAARLACAEAAAAAGATGRTSGEAQMPSARLIRDSFAHPWLGCKVH